MAGTFTPTGSYSNLTRLELEQLRKADFYAGLKGLTVGDSGLAPEGVVGKGDINAEQFYTGPTLTVDDVFGVPPPPRPGAAIKNFTDFYGVQSETVAWYGPAEILSDNAGGSTTAPDTFTDLSQNFVGAGVLAGDVILIRKSSLNLFATAVIQNPIGVNTLTCSAVNNQYAAGSNAFVTEAPGAIQYTIIRPLAAQLFAVPGSGPTGEEQTFLMVTPGSGIHNIPGPTLNAINAARIKNIVPPNFGQDTTVDRADAVFPSPAPLDSLYNEGYRVILYPDDGTGTAPDLTKPIASLNPVIDPAIPAADQRLTIDYKAGIVRFSCAPKLGGDIKVPGGVNAITGRLNLYAVYWAVDQTFTKGNSRGLYRLRSNIGSHFTSGTFEWQEGSSTGSAGADWLSTHPIEAGSALSSGDNADATYPRFIGVTPSPPLSYVTALLMSQIMGGAEGSASFYLDRNDPSIVRNAYFDNTTGLWTRVAAGPAAKLTLWNAGGLLKLEAFIENTGAATWNEANWQNQGHGDPLSLNLDVFHFPSIVSQLLSGLQLGQGLTDYGSIDGAHAKVSEVVPRFETVNTPNSPTFSLAGQFTMTGGATGHVRIYVTASFDIIFTCNARWDPNTSLWNRDTALFAAVRVQFTGQSVRYADGSFGGGGLAIGWFDAVSNATWSESAWTSSGAHGVAFDVPGNNFTSGTGPVLSMGQPGYDNAAKIHLRGQVGASNGPNLFIDRSNLSGDATSFISLPNPTPAKNTLYSQNIVKMWAQVSDFIGYVGDSFNLSAWSHPGGSNFQTFTFCQALSATEYTVVCVIVNNTVDKVTPFSFNTTNFQVGFYNSGTSNPVNNGVGSNRVAIIVMGKQA